MGMFDMLNLRINGYDFHVAPDGRQGGWTDDKVKDVFTHWSELLPFQPERTVAHGRTRANALGDKRPGCTCSARSSRRTSTGDDPTPGHHRRHRLLRLPRDRPRARPGRGRGADRRVHDGGQARRTRTAPRRCSASSAAAAAIDAYIAINPAIVAASSEAEHGELHAAAAEVGRARRRGEVHRPVPRP